MTEQTSPPSTQLARDHTVADIATVVAGVNAYLGWYDDVNDRTMGEDVALLHSEVSEALEAYRKWGYDDPTPPYHSVPGCLPKPEGVGSELADVVIRLIDVYDRRRYLSRPWWWALRLDEIQPAYCRGITFGDWIAYLHELVSRAIYDQVLPYALAIAKEAGVDLFDEIQRKIAYNVTRGYRHGGKLL